MSEGEEFKEIMTIRKTRRVRDPNAKPINIPPMPRPWKPEIYPWKLKPENWSHREQDCWAATMRQDSQPACMHWLISNNRPLPKYPKFLYLRLLEQREEAIRRSKMPQYKIEYYDAK